MTHPKPNILCTICARGGSKGVPGKNIRPLQGNPLIAHTIEQAKRSSLFSAVSVSSDSDDILAVAREWGADLCIKRPDELATDTSGKLPAITHAVQASEKHFNTQYDICVDLDATSPLRDISDITNAVDMLQKNNCSNVITGCAAHRSPYFNMVEEDENGFVRLSKPLPNHVLRRQDAPTCFDMNASIYVWQRDILLQNPAVFYDDTCLYEMPAERSQDIDSELDFIIVETIMKHTK